MKDEKFQPNESDTPFTVKIDKKQLLIQAKEAYRKKQKRQMFMLPKEQLDRLLDFSKPYFDPIPVYDRENAVRREIFDDLCEIGELLFLTCEGIVDIVIDQPAPDLPHGYIGLLFTAKNPTFLGERDYGKFAEIAMYSDRVTVKTSQKGDILIEFCFRDILEPSEPEGGND